MELKPLDARMIFILGSIVFCAFLQLFQPHFIYLYDVFYLQPWRWWTGHWVHVGWVHYILNIVALACLPWIFPNIKEKYLVGLLFILPPLLSFSFYYFYPDIFAYAGLSGILHGLFIFSAIINLKQQREKRFALLILVGILGKIIWENYFGSLHTAELIGSPVLTQAHFLGAFYGAILAVICFVLNIPIVKSTDSKSSIKSYYLSLLSNIFRSK